MTCDKCHLLRVACYKLVYMFKLIRKHRAQSTLEYVVLLIFVMGAFLVFQKYIVRGFSGRWKSVGDSWGNGRLYDPKKTVECANDMFNDRENVWYNVPCFEAACVDSCLKVYVPATCTSCIDSCQAGCN